MCDMFWNLLTYVHFVVNDYDTNMMYWEFIGT